MGKSKYSNVLKAYCVDNGLIDLVNSRKKYIYKSNDINAQTQLWLDIANHSEIDCSNRLLESKYRKYSRARKFVKRIVDMGQSVFITLTFTNDVLEKTSANTRRKYVARFLKEQAPYYMANIDFSPDKDREHYHAVVSNRVDMNKWSYGFVWVEKVRAKECDSDKVSRYITKLTSHAFKVDCSRLLYSRNVLQ